MYRYTIRDGLIKIGTELEKSIEAYYDIEKYESLADSIGYSIFQDSFVVDDSSEHHNQDYSIAINKFIGNENSEKIGLAFESDYVVEIQAYDDVKIVFVDDIVAVYKLLGELLPTQNLIKERRDNLNI